MGTSSPSGSTDTTPSGASLLIATPSIERLRVIAGSVVWKNRSASRSPPRSRMTRRPFARMPGSATTLKPSAYMQAMVQPMIARSVLQIRRAPPL